MPTFAESGFKDFDLEVWFGVTAPAKIPKDATAELIAWFTGALRADAVKQKLTGQGLNLVGRCGVEFSAQLRRQYDNMGRVIREANIKAE